MGDVNEEHRNSYNANAACFKPGIKPGEVINNYDQWSVESKYEEVKFGIN